VAGVDNHQVFIACFYRRGAYHHYVKSAAVSAGAGGIFADIRCINGNGCVRFPEAVSLTSTVLIRLLLYLYSLSALPAVRYSM
jgi:hypothetical protein